jgi:hypothetical protein
MTENLPAEPTRQAIEAKGRTAPGRVTGKLKIAIERLVWFGDRRPDAATAAGLTDHGLRSALRKPHVLGYLRSELALLREGERPRNVHRLAALRDQDDNRNAAVAAINVLEKLTDDPRSAVNISLHVSAGYIIDLTDAPRDFVVVGPKAATPHVIEHEPAAANEVIEDE